MIVSLDDLYKGIVDFKILVIELATLVIFLRFVWTYIKGEFK